MPICEQTPKATTFSGHRGAVSIQYFDKGAFCLGELLRNVGLELTRHHSFYDFRNRDWAILPASESWADLKLIEPFGQRTIDGSPQGILYFGYTTTPEDALNLAEAAHTSHPQIPIIGIGTGKLKVSTSAIASFSDLDWYRLLQQKGIGFFPLVACVKEFSLPSSAS